MEEDDNIVPFNSGCNEDTQKVSESVDDKIQHDYDMKVAREGNDSREDLYDKLKDAIPNHPLYQLKLHGVELYRWAYAIAAKVEEDTRDKYGEHSIIMADAVLYSMCSMPNSIGAFIGTIIPEDYEHQGIDPSKLTKEDK